MRRPKAVRTKTSLVLVLVQLHSAFAVAGVQWSHVEWGGANYAMGSSTPDLTNSIKTIAELIHLRGPRGTFFLNDNFSAEGVNRAVVLLRQEAATRSWTDLNIQPLPGDYKLITPLNTTSAHMKNPHQDFLDSFRAPRTIQRLANASETGLIVDTFFEMPDRGMVVREIGEGMAWNARDWTSKSSRYLVERSPARGVALPGDGREAMGDGSELGRSEVASLSRRGTVLFVRAQYLGIPWHHARRLAAMEYPWMRPLLRRRLQGGHLDRSSSLDTWRYGPPRRSMAISRQ